MVSFWPPLSETEVAQCKEFGKVCSLNEHFRGIDVNLFENKPTYSQIKIFCPDAKFRLKASECEKVYTDIFYSAFGQIGILATNIFHKGFRIEEFSFLHRTYPKEKPQEFVPMVPLKTIGAFLYWKKLFAMGLNEDITTNISNNDDKLKLKEITKETVDARPLVSENRDFILRTAEELGLWKRYRSMDDFKPTLYADPRLKEAFENVIQEHPETITFYHYMPLTEDELILINQAINNGHGQ